MKTIFRHLIRALLVWGTARTGANGKRPAQIFLRETVDQLAATAIL